MPACESVGMILLISPTISAAQCSQALQKDTGLPVLIAPIVSEAASQLRAREFRVVIFDELALEFEPEEAETLLTLQGSAVPVFVNFAMHGERRVLGEVRAALRRREADERSARTCAQQSLRKELKETVTAILLSCDLLMTQAELPPRATEKVRTVQELAGTLRSQLGELV